VRTRPAGSDLAAGFPVRSHLVRATSHPRCDALEQIVVSIGPSVGPSREHGPASGRVSMRDRVEAHRVAFRRFEGTGRRSPV